MSIVREFCSLAALNGDGLRPELRALFDRLAKTPSELFVRSDGMTQSGSDPVSETGGQVRFLPKSK